MFETMPPPQLNKAFSGVDDAGVMQAITAASCQQNVQCARELAAIGELYARRSPDSDVDRFNWAVDRYADLVAEIAAALRISRGRAAGRLNYAIALHERLPRFAEVFARGDVDFRLMAAVVHQTELIEDPVVAAKVDEAIARHAHQWMRLSAPKLAERIGMWVAKFDPAGRRFPGLRNQDRYVEIWPIESGRAGIEGQLQACDGAALDRRLDALAGTVCRDDPRTKKQRRADALGALAAGLDAMACQCGRSECPAAGRRPGTDVVIHVLAEQATVGGDSTAPGYLPGFGPIPPKVLREMADTAKIKPLVMPPDCAEPRYRPSTALAEFIRARDLTCRFPGCSEPAAVCQIDHTVPWPMGPTHPSNLKLLCVFHHLLKTFYTGVGGWADRQLPDGTLIWTSPSGCTYRTTPVGGIFFPVLAAPTGTPTIRSGIVTPDTCRGLMMPRRQRTRTEDRLARITAERRRNEARLAEKHRKWLAKLAADNDPPPF